MLAMVMGLLVGPLIGAGYRWSDIQVPSPARKKATTKHRCSGSTGTSILRADHEATIRQLHVDLETRADTSHDMGTNDFLTELMERHEKMAWMLRAFLEGKSV